MGYKATTYWAIAPILYRFSKELTIAAIRIILEKNISFNNNDYIQLVSKVMGTKVCADLR